MAAAKPKESRSLNLVQKLAEIQKMADVVVRNKKGANNMYAEIEQALAKVTAGMHKYGVSLQPRIQPGTTSVEPVSYTTTKFDKSGKQYESTTFEYLVRAEGVYRWLNNEDAADLIDIPWVFVGSQRDPSQAFGSALTYCKRYFLKDFFHIAEIGEDPDSYRGRQKEAAEAEEREIAEAIITEFEKILLDFVSSHEEKKDEVKKLISKYAKNANYKAIKNPELAAKLMKEFKDTYIPEEGKKEEE